MLMDRITIGSAVHYCIGELNGLHEWRPATVVREWGGGCVNLQVQVDGANDLNDGRPGITHGPNREQADHGIMWATSVMEGNEPGCWRWSPR